MKTAKVARYLKAEVADWWREILIVGKWIGFVAAILIGLPLTLIVLWFAFNLWPSIKAENEEDTPYHQMED